MLFPDVAEVGGEGREAALGLPSEPLGGEGITQLWQPQDSSEVRGPGLLGLTQDFGSFGGGTIS